MAIQINKVTNANVYADGNSWIGRAEEVKLPTLTAKMVEHKALGMVGTLELPTGIDKLEGEIKWNGPYTDVLRRVANPFKPVQLQLRSNVQQFGAGGLVVEVPMVTYLTVLFTDTDLGGYKQHENVENTSKYRAYYVKQTLNGEDVVELDVMANVYRVGGVDLLANYRVNIGG